MLQIHTEAAIRRSSSLRYVKYVKNITFFRWKLEDKHAAILVLILLEESQLIRALQLITDMPEELLMVTQTNVTIIEAALTRIYKIEIGSISIWELITE